MTTESPRNRRLKLDFDKLQARFTDSKTIKIVNWTGIPAEKYTIEYSLKGIYSDESGKIRERDTHLLEINLSLGYPRRAPQCKMSAPVFHPNFDDVSVCIGDFWAPSEGLDDLIIRIGRMIAYQEYNIKSPLNGLAAKWADANSQILPVDKREIAPANATFEKSDIEKIIVSIPNNIDIESEFGDFMKDALSKKDEQSVYLKCKFPRLDFGSFAVQVNDPKCTIGRSLGNSIIIPQDEISTYHAEISVEDNIYTLKELEPTSGTFVNNNILISDIEIQHGDRIQFGNIEAIFLLY